MIAAIYKMLIFLTTASCVYARYIQDAIFLGHMLDTSSKYLIFFCLTSHYKDHIFFWMLEEYGMMHLLPNLNQIVQKCTGPNLALNFLGHLILEGRNLNLWYRTHNDTLYAYTS